MASARSSGDSGGLRAASPCRPPTSSLSPTTYDRNAVRVVVMGEQVGHVPQEVSAAIARVCAGVGRGNVATVLARIWARNDDGTWRSRVTLMFSGDRESEKDYAAERRAADAYYAEREAERARKDAEKAAREAQKEARRTAGAVEGQYWPLLKPSISELKRQKRMEEARDLLEQNASTPPSARRVSRVKFRIPGRLSRCRSFCVASVTIRVNSRSWSATSPRAEAERFRSR